MKKKTKIVVLIIVILYIILLPFRFTLKKPGCFFAGDQWGKQDVKFFIDRNGELKKITYVDSFVDSFVFIDPNSPDWGTWKRRYWEFQHKL